MRTAVANFDKFRDPLSCMPIWARLRLMEMEAKTMDPSEPIIRRRVYTESITSVTVNHSKYYTYKVETTYKYFDGYDWVEDFIYFIVSKDAGRTGISLCV